jgi:hypothetical protein
LVWLFRGRRGERDQAPQLQHWPHYARAGRRRNCQRRRKVREVRIHDDRPQDDGGPREQEAQGDKSVPVRSVRQGLRREEGASSSHDGDSRLQVEEVEKERGEAR